jgi:hypothetical protein
VGIFEGLSGFLQVRIILKKAWQSLRQTFFALLARDRLADAAPSLKPQALRVSAFDTGRV